MKKILVLSRYDILAASARQRFKLYEKSLLNNGFELDIKPLFTNLYLKRIFSRKKTNFFGIILSYLKRFFIILTARRYDIVWLQYEAFPYLPSFTEKILPLINKNIVCDFDDAIFHKYDDWGGFLTKKILGKKLNTIIINSRHVICGNQYIEDWARQFSNNTVIIPTVVCCERYTQSAPKNQSEILIGWIGSPATWCYVEPYVDLLSDLAKQYEFKILIIGSGFSNNDKNFIFRDWSEDTEINNLHEIDIGIMPLTDDKWANGKCGYKIIQYMATSTPVIASPVGVNSKIITHNQNGFLANTEQEWSEYIIRLAEDPKLRKSMGDIARKNIQDYYSLDSQDERIIKLFHSILK